MTTGAAASGRTFLRVFLSCLAVCALRRGWCAAVVSAQISSEESHSTIERIEFVGNRRIARDTLLARIFSRQGDPYSEEAVRRDFLALWNTQFFEDIRLEVEDSPDNARRENRRLLCHGTPDHPPHRVQGKQIHQRIGHSRRASRTRKSGLTVESQFDPTKIKHAEVVIKQLLAEHGRQFAVVRPTYEKIAATNAVKARLQY